MSKTIERTFHLTWEDINGARQQFEAEGNRFDADTNCPIHRCLARELAPGNRLIANQEYAHVDMHGEGPDICIDFPQEVKWFISDFDNKRFYECKPFDFTLEIPEELL